MLFNRHSIRFSRSDAQRRRADGLRRTTILFGIFSTLIFGVATAQLANPAESQFAPDSSSRSAVRTALFTDHDISNRSNGKKSRIRQVSGEPPSAWDIPSPAYSQNGSSVNGDGPALAAPANGDDSTSAVAIPAWGPPSTSATAANDNSQSGFGPLPASPLGTQPNDSQSANPYFNTQTAPNAIPGVDPNAYAAAMQGLQNYAQNPNAMQQGGRENPYAAQTGMGYYDPTTGNVFGNPYATGGIYSPYNNPYQLQQYQQMQQLQQIQQMQWMQQMQMMGQQGNGPFQGFGPGFNGGRPHREMDEKENAESGSKRKGKKDDEQEPPPGSEWTMKRLAPVKVSSPLFETCCTALKTLSPFNTPDGPDRGCGQPLQMRSWQDHPYYFGGFCGWIYGSQLVDNMIDQNSGANGGIKLGYNFNDYWGVEGRLHFASISIHETSYGKEVYNAWYAATYPDSPYVPLTTRSNQLTSFDVSVQYFPLGNAKWRPYFTYGLGFTHEAFIDTYGVKNKVNAMCMPLGVGLRYWWNEKLAIQFDILDNVVFANGQAKTQNNFAFTVGISYAFGSSGKCRPTSYWPYTPSSGSKY